MFIGHFGVGLAGKGAANKTSLGTLFFAAQFVDLLWPTLLLLGWETVHISPGITIMTPLDFEHYPISHSLAASIGWAALFTVIYGFITKYWKGAFVVGALVLSHWFLDLLVHRPDLPLYPGGTKVGLGLWNVVPVEIALEAAIFIAGVWIYLRSTQAKDRTGTIALWSLIVFLVLIHVLNLTGGEPPSETAIAWVSQSQWLIVLWGGWGDRHRTSVPVRAGSGSSG